MQQMWKKTDDPKTSFDEAAPESRQAEAPPSASRAPAAASRQSASIGPSITIRGDITGEEDLVVHGRIEGTLTLPDNNIVIGADGQVKANLNATKITVEGHVSGDLNSSERVVIRQSGRVEGNITAPRVVLEDGCRFKGAVEMNMDSSAAARKSGAGPVVGGRSEGAAKVADIPGGDSKVVRASGGS
jgi:cytoskeletal protein CcmA (bactofilin family)